MSSVSRTFTVASPPELVVPYLADFANAEQWDPGTERCVPVANGPVTVGSKWRNTSKIFGVTTELTYTLEHLDEQTIVLVGRNDTATSTETIKVTRHSNRSQITYTNEVVFNGAAKLVAPLAKVVFEKLGKDTEKQMTQTLDALQPEI